jgi:hypothetical protein
MNKLIEGKEIITSVEKLKKWELKQKKSSQIYQSSQ